MYFSRSNWIKPRTVMLPFAQMLHAKKERLRLSHEEMAQSLGVSRGYFSAVQRGDRPLTPHLQQKLEELYFQGDSELDEFRYCIQISERSFQMPSTVGREAFEFFHLLRHSAEALNESQWRALRVMLGELSAKQNAKRREVNMTT